MPSRWVKSAGEAYSLGQQPPSRDLRKCMATKCQLYVNRHSHFVGRQKPDTGSVKVDQVPYERTNFVSFRVACSVKRESRQTFKNCPEILDMGLKSGGNTRLNKD